MASPGLEAQSIPLPVIPPQDDLADRAASAWWASTYMPALTTAQPAVYILRGISGSGKTSVVSALRASFPQGAVRVCTIDDYFLHRPFDASLLPEAHEACKHDFLSALRDRVPIICIDNSNTRQREYVDYLSMLAAHNSAVGDGSSHGPLWPLNPVPPQQATERQYAVFVVEIIVPELSLAEYFATRCSRKVPVDLVFRQASRFEPDPRAIRLHPFVPPSALPLIAGIRARNYAAANGMDLAQATEFVRSAVAAVLPSTIMAAAASSAAPSSAAVTAATTAAATSPGKSAQQAHAQVKGAGKKQAAAAGSPASSSSSSAPAASAPAAVAPTTTTVLGKPSYAQMASAGPVSAPSAAAAQPVQQPSASAPKGKKAAASAATTSEAAAAAPVATAAPSSSGKPPKASHPSSPPKQSVASAAATAPVSTPPASVVGGGGSSSHHNTPGSAGKASSSSAGNAAAAGSGRAARRSRGASMGNGIEAAIGGAGSKHPHPHPAHHAAAHHHNTLIDAEAMPLPLEFEGPNPHPHAPGHHHHLHGPVGAGDGASGSSASGKRSRAGTANAAEVQAPAAPTEAATTSSSTATPAAAGHGSDSSSSAAATGLGAAHTHKGETEDNAAWAARVTALLQTEQPQQQQAQLTIPASLTDLSPRLWEAVQNRLARRVVYLAFFLYGESRERLKTSPASKPRFDVVHCDHMTLKHLPSSGDISISLMEVLGTPVHLLAQRCYTSTKRGVQAVTVSWADTAASNASSTVSPTTAITSGRRETRAGSELIESPDMAEAALRLLHSPSLGPRPAPGMLGGGVEATPAHLPSSSPVSSTTPGGSAVPALPSLADMGSAPAASDAGTSGRSTVAAPGGRQPQNARVRAAIATTGIDKSGLQLSGNRHPHVVVSVRSSVSPIVAHDMIKEAVKEANKAAGVAAGATATGSVTSPGSAAAPATAAATATATTGRERAGSVSTSASGGSGTSPANTTPTPNAATVVDAPLDLFGRLGLVVADGPECKHRSYILNKEQLLAFLFNGVHGAAPTSGAGAGAGKH